MDDRLFTGFAMDRMRAERDDARNLLRGERERASQLAAEANDALWAIMQECEGRRFHQSGYDITLDHIYDTAEAVRDLFAAGVVSSTQPEPVCHEWAFDETIGKRYCVACGVEDSDPPTAIRFALCPEGSSRAAKETP